MKEIVILGGPNGAGKTTAARVLLREFLTGHPFLNADEIARQISPDHPDGAAFAAGRQFIEQMRKLIRKSESFAFETTCAGKSYLPVLQGCKQAGWRVVLIYFWLPSPELAVQRVAGRVAQGGHSIPTETIYRRYQLGVANMRNLYLPLADEAEIYDNSCSPRILIAENRIAEGLRIHDPDRWKRIEEISR